MVLTDISGLEDIIKSVGAHTQSTETSNKKTYKRQRLTHGTDSLHCKDTKYVGLNQENA